MTERPLTTEELRQLREVLGADAAPEPHGEAWDATLRRVFDAAPDAPLHSDLDDADLLPDDWPDESDAADGAPGIADFGHGADPGREPDHGWGETDHGSFSGHEGLDQAHHGHDGFDDPGDPHE